MIKYFFRFLILITIFIFGFISYFSIIGFETKKFNSLIKSNLNSIDKQIDIKLNVVKIILDPFSLNLHIKTLGPNILYNNNLIELESVKTQISLSSIINKKISSSNLSISTKLIKINDLTSFIRAIKNTPEFTLVDKIIDKGFVIADLNINFDENGKISDDYELKGIIKDVDLTLLDNNQLRDINFNFIHKSSKTELKDISFAYRDLKIISNELTIINKDKEIFLKGELDTKLITINEKEISDYFDYGNNLEIKKIKFSSTNDFEISLTKRFKIENYDITSSVNIEDLVLKNFLNLKYFFPEMKETISLKDNKINLISKKNSFKLSGSGKTLLQKELDEVSFEVIKKDNSYIFDSNFDISNNPIKIKFLNFENSKKIKTTLSLQGKYIKDQNLSFDTISFVNDKNIIEIDNLKFDKNYKISDLNHASIKIVDELDKKNQFSINKKKNHYNISGKNFNASILVDDLITKDDDQNQNLFSDDLNLKLDIDEVLIAENHIIKNLNGDINFEKNNINKANLKGSFSKNENISFSVIKKNDQKVTTFFSDKAEPFVKKFKFIKGFDGGSLDFYSVESGNTSNSQIKLYDFKLKEVSALTKILTLASLQGIADLLSGEGIRFDDFEMKFQNQKNLIKINEVYAIGPAISILMDGYIEKDKLISLRGTLVPATTINKFIGSIPILGDILVGKKTGEGVFGVSFKIKGPPKKTETTVNPIKTLTPRFITRTLEKIKKN
ncbi:hypothetical protein [Candidatus Pelagibacter sp.]|uniref:hypothetical protein n=1 Tax=Candidatus Pelagibacter sp. TaxID=2024849 RepID=UPI003F8462E6